MSYTSPKNEFGDQVNENTFGDYTSTRIIFKQFLLDKVVLKIMKMPVNIEDSVVHDEYYLFQNKNDYIEHDMVISFETYKKRLEEHRYNPLLYTSTLGCRLAYLYGCLNFEKNTSQSYYYTFFWRHKGFEEWKDLYTVFPYKDTDELLKL